MDPQCPLTLASDVPGLDTEEQEGPEVSQVHLEQVKGTHVAAGRGCDYKGGEGTPVGHVDHQLLCPSVDTGASDDPSSVTLATEATQPCPWSLFWFPKTFL